ARHGLPAGAQPQARGRATIGRTAARRRSTRDARVVAVTANTQISQPPRQYYCPSCERTYPEGTHCPEDGPRLVRIRAVADPLLGRNLDDRYTIVEKLGQGGMGAVYRGEQHSVGREVAIKLVSPHLVSEPDVIKRFLREAKLASRLTHPNAVAVLDFGQTED